MYGSKTPQRGEETYDPIKSHLVNRNCRKKDVGGTFIFDYACHEGGKAKSWTLLVVYIMI